MCCIKCFFYKKSMLYLRSCYSNTLMYTLLHSNLFIILSFYRGSFSSVLSRGMREEISDIWMNLAATISINNQVLSRTRIHFLKVLLGSCPLMIGQEPFVLLAPIIIVPKHAELRVKTIYIKVVLRHCQCFCLPSVIIQQSNMQPLYITFSPELCMLCSCSHICCPHRGSGDWQFSNT